MALLEVKNLTTRFYSRNGVSTAVDDISFSVNEGETLAIVGESGSGKSVSCYSLLNLIPKPPGKIESGVASFKRRRFIGTARKSDAKNSRRSDCDYFSRSDD